MKLKSPFLSIVIFILFISTGNAQLSFSGLFNDHMVLQRGKKTAIWGKAIPKATVELSFNKELIQTSADEKGEWEITLPFLKAGGPHKLTVRSEGQSVSLSNVMVGDVYLASGQSNMEWRIDNGISTPEEVSDQPLLRYAKMHRSASGQPQDTATLNWFEAVEGKVEKCSAVAYFFAKAVIEEQNIPVGIIENAVGGSPVEAWISPEMLQNTPAFRARIRDIQAGQVNLGPRGKTTEVLRKASEEKTNLFQAEASKTELPDIEGLHQWKPIRFPSSLEKAGLYNFDGSIWLKKEFYWPYDTRGKATLVLGRVDDDDHTYLNGTYVGSTYGENVESIYELPDSVLRNGNNILLVKLHDRHYIGGLLGPSDRMFLSLKQEHKNVRFPITGEWTYLIAEEERIDPLFYHYPFFEPTVLYNSSIHPLLDLNITGVIWYQGESNSGRGVQYRSLFERMILDWRIRFRQGNFPFLFVQLANFQKKSDGTKADYWAELREAQAMALDLPNTAMVTAIDLGEANDIHPRNKQGVGERLALAALHKIYGKKVVYNGPLYKSHRIVKDSVFIQFQSQDNGLLLKDQPITGFVVAGADQAFYPAMAKMAGDHQVVVWSEQVKKPEAVRYAWAQNPYLSVFNEFGMPALPFRTDDWVEKSKFK